MNSNDITLALFTQLPRGALISSAGTTSYAAAGSLDADYGSAFTSQPTSAFSSACSSPTRLQYELSELFPAANLTVALPPNTEPIKEEEWKRERRYG